MSAAFDEGAGHVSRVIAEAAAAQRGWRQRVRACLDASLEFLDEQPDWARFLIVESSLTAVMLAERRQRAVRVLARALERETRPVDDGARAVRSARLTAELIVGGVLAVVLMHLRERPERRLTSLTPALMTFIERPYRTGRGSSEPEQAGPARRVTYRTARVLSAIAAAPRSNNRAIAEAAGLRDEGQTSKLLSRLEGRGLLENVGLGAAYGEPNAWLLTADGERELHTVGQFHRLEGRGTRGARVRSVA
ncbi:MAG TPA: hypothetical protein VMB51_08110 [Solirubrobacteraceae bacterium]|nr:hypothetical protein [Solirubrobacteraceae bacterium]